MTRTNNKWIRPYLNALRVGVDAVNVGNVGVAFDVAPLTSYLDEIKNAIPGRAEISVDALNAVMSPGTAASIHDLCADGTGTFDYMIAYGINAVPAAGNPIFAWRFDQAGYMADAGDGFVMCNVTLKPTFASNNAAVQAGYDSPFGILIHADGAETGTNTAVGIDDIGAASAKGGVMFYHLFSSNGTVTLKIQEASTNSNGSFGDLTGATSGSIDASAAPVSGMAALSKTAAVKQFLRWQLAFGTADTATFVIGFIRGR